MAGADEVAPLGVCGDAAEGEVMRQTGLGRAVLLAAILMSTPAAGDVRPKGDDLFGPLFGAKVEDAPVAFSGDMYYWDRNTNVITGYGAVQIEQGGRTLEADEIRLYLDTQIADLEGHVAISQEGQTVFGESATYDLAQQRGTFEKPRTYLDPWYVSAEDIARTSPTKYQARHSRVTTCDRTRPHWSISIGDLDIDDEDGTVRGRNVVGRIGRVPVFYAPVYAQRTDRKRPPIDYDVGFQSDVGGFVKFGFPVDIGENIELQPRVEGYTESGVAAGLGADGILFERTRFHTDIWYINDLSEDNLDDRGITSNRHKIDWYSRTTLPDDWVMLAQLEWLSDRRVLETFFWDDFQKREEPESFIDFTRTKPHTVFEVLARKRFDDFTVTTDYLPLVRADLLEYRLWDSPVYVSASADAAYAELKPEDRHLAFSRQELRLSAPYRAARWLNAVPFVELEGRYHKDGNLGTRDADYDAWARPGVTLQSRFHTAFDSPLARYSRMRHLFEPTVTYAWRDADTPDPEDLAFFDSSEVHVNENSIEVELRNKIQGRRLDGAIEDLIEFQTTLDFAFDRSEDKLARIENELIIRPADRWLISAQSVHDFRDSEEAADVSARISYTDPRGISAHMGVVYADARGEPWSSEVFYGVAMPLGDTWRVGFEQRVDADSGELDGQEYWVWHQHHCCEAAVSVRDRQESFTVMVMIGLSAFPNRQLEQFRDPDLLQKNLGPTASLFGNDLRQAQRDLTPRAPTPAPTSAPTSAPTVW